MGSQMMKDQVGQLHAYIDKELSTREAGAASRKDQPPVIVSCFSGLSWKYALLAYDGVRAHEVKAAKGKINATNADLLDAREVTFAPPRIRNYSSNEMSNELYEIVHLR